MKDFINVDDNYKKSNFRRGKTRMEIKIRLE